MCIMNNESHHTRHHTMNLVETSSWNNNYELLKLQCTWVKLEVSFYPRTCLLKKTTTDFNKSFKWTILLKNSGTNRVGYTQLNFFGL